MDHPIPVFFTQFLSFQQYICSKKRQKIDSHPYLYLRALDIILWTNMVGKVPTAG